MMVGEPPRTQGGKGQRSWAQRLAAARRQIGEWCKYICVGEGWEEVKRAQAGWARLYVRSRS